MDAHQMMNRICRSFFLLSVMVALAGCKGPITNGQKLELKEDPVVNLPKVDPPPQRLATSSQTDKQTQTSAKPDVFADETIQTRLSPKPPSRSAAVEALLAANRNKRNSQTKPAVAVKDNRRDFNPQPKTQPQTKTQIASTRSPATRANATTSRSAPAKTSSVRTVSNQQPRKTAATASARTPSPATRTATANKSSSTAKKSFTQLPREVKQQALRRLIQEVADKADKTRQPSSIDTALAARLRHMPTLPDYVEVRSETKPKRIAAGRGGTISAIGQLETVKVADLQLRNYPPNRTRPESTTTIRTKTITNKPRPSSQSFSATNPAPKPPMPVFTQPIARKNAAAEEPVIRSGPEQKEKEVLFELPPPPKVVVAPIVQSKPPAPPTPQIDNLSKHEPAEQLRVLARDSRNQVQTAPPRPSLTPNAPIAHTQPQPRQTPLPKQLVLPTDHPALTDHIRDTSRSIVLSSGPKPFDPNEVKLSAPALSQELVRPPHRVQRDQFKFNTVELPDPGYVSRPQKQSPRIAVSLPTPPKAEPKSTVAGSDTTKTKTEAVSITMPTAPKPATGTLLLPEQMVRQATSATSASESIQLPTQISIPSEIPADSPVQNVSHSQVSAVPLINTETQPNLPAPAPAAAKSKPEPTIPTGLTDQQLYETLLARLTDPSHAETDAEKQRRMIMARHLMVLAGQPNDALERMEGLSKEEQQYLRHQLEGLWTIIDPKGHPASGRRFSSALPKLREATKHLSAASDVLEVRNIEFCTEIEAYGQIKPFTDRRFKAGQQVILYCEIENFTTRQSEAGYETHLRGSYAVYDENKEKMVSHLLPADKQNSRSLLRDLFVGWQLSLPKNLKPGIYELILTMEDVASEKYGQAKIRFEIIGGTASTAGSL